MIHQQECPSPEHMNQTSQDHQTHTLSSHKWSRKKFLKISSTGLLDLAFGLDRVNPPGGFGPGTLPEQLSARAMDKGELKPA